jgi:hypothetical protein
MSVRISRTATNARHYARLSIVPISWRAAQAYVNARHRHLQAPPGAKLAIAVIDARGRLRGVAILGRPVARVLDDGVSIEVVRVATDGCRNACSALYGAARRVARALGYHRLYTYTLASEPGTSLRAAGWTSDRASRGGLWSRADRPRKQPRNSGPKRRWIIELASA